MPRRATTLILAMCSAVCLLASCGGDKDEPASALSDAERDSVLSESALPGAGAVKGALAASDSAKVRAERASEAAKQ